MRFSIVTFMLAVVCMLLNDRRTTTVSSLSAVPVRKVKSNSKPSVAVIGGGIAGLSCAASLQQSDRFQVTVFDTGRLRPGGRCSSRMPRDVPKDDAEYKFPILSNALFDHAAQILSVPLPANTTFHNDDDDIDFAKQVERWKEDGIIKQYNEGSVCDIVKDGSDVLSVVPLDTDNMFHGVRGMGSIPLAIVREGQFAVEQDVWVSPSNGVKYLKNKRQWKVKGPGHHDGGGGGDTFDFLVIAHNGKCADRLMSRTPARALHSLLRVNFAPTVPNHGGKRMTLNSIYSLTVCLKSPSVLSRALPEPFVCGFVSSDSSSKDLRFISCQSRKYPRTEDDVEVWTILSSPKFAKRYKAPQENLPEDLVNDVTDQLLTAVTELLNLSKSTLMPSSILERRLQLWGAAVPLNIYKGGGADGFVWDSKFGVGICGDWLVEPSIVGAWESGKRLAKYMIEDGSKSIGLPSGEEPAVFQVSSSVSKAGIGSIQPGETRLSTAAS